MPPQVSTLPPQELVHEDNKSKKKKKREKRLKRHETQPEGQSESVASPSSPSHVDIHELVALISELKAMCANHDAKFASQELKNAAFESTNAAFRLRLDHVEQEHLKDRAILHKIARRVLLDDAREKVANLASGAGWEALMEATDTNERRKVADLILENSGQFSRSQREKAVELLVGQNSTCDEGDVAGHAAAQELTWDAIEALDEDSEHRLLLSGVYTWIYSSIPT